MNFTIRFAYRRSYSHSTFCNDTTISMQTLMGQTGNIICMEGCARTNEILANSLIHCLAYSVLDDWIYGTKTFSYLVEKTMNYQVRYHGGDWGELQVYGYNRTYPDALWEVRHKIDSRVRNDTQRVNSAPINLMTPLITLPKDIIYILQIATLDYDGDIVKCSYFF